MRRIPPTFAGFTDGGDHVQGPGRVFKEQQPPLTASKEMGTLVLQSQGTIF